VIKQVEFGVKSVKKSFSTLIIDERYGLMVTFEEAQPPKCSLNCWLWLPIGCSGWGELVKRTPSYAV